MECDASLVFNLNVRVGLSYRVQVLGSLVQPQRSLVQNHIMRVGCPERRPIATSYIAESYGGHFGVVFAPSPPRRRKVGPCRYSRRDFTPLLPPEVAENKP